MSNYTTTLTGHVSTVHKHSKAYIEKQRSLSTSMDGFAGALKQMASCEAATNDVLSKSFSQMSLTIDRLSTLYADQGSRGAVVFEEPMRGYIRILEAVKQAIAAREASLKKYNNASSVLAAKKEKLEKAKASKDGQGKEQKVATATREVTGAEESASLAKADYDNVVARVDAEMARFQLEKLADFKKFVVEFVKLQIEYSTRVQGAWRDLLPSLDAMQDVSAPTLPRRATDKVDLS